MRKLCCIILGLCMISGYVSAFEPMEYYVEESVVTLWMEDKLRYGPISDVTTLEKYGDSQLQKKYVSGCPIGSVLKTSEKCIFEEKVFFGGWLPQGLSTNLLKVHIIFPGIQGIDQNSSNDSQPIIINQI